jgi:hypothetical protein
MTKLDNDAASAAVRPSLAAPAKAAVPPATVYNPRAPNPFAEFFDLPAVKAALPPGIGSDSREATAPTNTAKQPALCATAQGSNSPADICSADVRGIVQQVAHSVQCPASRGNAARVHPLWLSVLCMGVHS